MNFQFLRKPNSRKPECWNTDFYELKRQRATSRSKYTETVKKDFGPKLPIKVRNYNSFERKHIFTSGSDRNQCNNLDEFGQAGILK